ncbi:isochorismate synthase [Reinekea sp.]|uniref:isochorismate synthase n=1 Tax=Reinekea sp. TaxID=1970455 RepID=UPI002A812C64|nr:isochorismate synthase [Reinekea sp.]
MSEQRLDSSPTGTQRPAAPWLENVFDLAVRQLQDRLARLEPRLGQLVHVSIDVPCIDTLRWLADNPHHDQSYWQNRDSQFALAGLGQAMAFEADDIAEIDRVMAQIDSALKRADCSHTRPVFVGGLSFDNHLSGHWQTFSAVSFRAPLCFLHQQQGQYELGFNLYSTSLAGWQHQSKSLKQLLAKLCFDAPPRVRQKNVIRLRQDSFNPETWRASVAQTLKAIEQGKIEKAVLARRVDLTLARAANLPELLARWRNKNPHSFSFLLSQPGWRFLGCSPERLFRRRHQRLDTEAIAGTLPRGATRAEDFCYGQQLLTDPKLRLEHRLVGDFIGQQLKPYCADIDTQCKTHILKLSAIQHLCQPIQASLTPGVPNHALLQALHPTPAVCGYPRQVAHHLINALEPVGRGWYSGAVGVVSDAGAEFAVAIRSALSHNNQLFCYSGVGIVEGSVAEQEWQELESKLHALLELIEQ